MVQMPTGRRCAEAVPAAERDVCSTLACRALQRADPVRKQSRPEATWSREGVDADGAFAAPKRLQPRLRPRLRRGEPRSRDLAPHVAANLYS